MNLLVDNSDKTEPPIIFENHPNFSNLFGRIEKKFFQGGFFTDHTMLKAGSLCLADGGYLIVNLLDVLMEPGVWQKLKRVLKSGVLRIEELSEYFGFPASISLKPADIPINVKVIAIADIQLFNLLTYFDEEFLSVFKVRAEFNHEMEANPENLSAYTGFIAFCCQKEGLLPFDKTAVAKMAEFGIRIAGNQKKISTQFGKIKNLVIEASYWAKKDEAQAVRAEHVEKALKEKIKRTSLLHEKSQENIIEGTLLIDTGGPPKVGQVNGLVVYEMGELWFGRPSKVTAKTFIGKEGIVSIEREVKFSGPISDKATFILKGYLASKYAQDKPFSLSGTLCFEQSYGPIEGDSASIAELAAIVSSISKIPINQSFAVTGSMNQDGDVQPIGGVNDKIEGFFDICEKRGLTGEQGVVIPYSNIKHLMLREDVIEAVKNHQFHIYAAKTADEAMELLMDKDIREIDGAVNERLREVIKIISETLKDQQTIS